MIYGQTPKAKFKIGAKVWVKHPMFPHFEGEVLASANTGDDIEYRVSNAPMIVPGLPVLLWESELWNM
jgi:hypothetical protein